MGSRKAGHSDRTAVPNWLVGLWQRESLQFADGTIDRTTRVFWGQTRSLCVDIRVPISRPEAKNRTSLRDFTLGELRLLAEKKGFSGRITLNDDRCSWIRYIDYRPNTGRPDEGRLRVNGDTLYEEGDPTAVLGKSYQEIYHRKSKAEKVCAALRSKTPAGLQSKQVQPGGSVLILLDNWFLYARARQFELPVGETLVQLVDQADGDRKTIQDYLDCEFSLGHIRAREFTWQVQLSTLPYREGTVLFGIGRAECDDTTLVLTHSDSNEPSHWEIIESNLSSDELASMFKASARDDLSP